MAYEPDYQTQSPTKDDVIRAVKTSWFPANLNKKRNTYEDNEKLKRYTNVKVTFEEIRRVPDWRERTDAIIAEEVDIAEKEGFGSIRGYYTFVHAQLCAIVQRRVVQEVFAVNKLKQKLMMPTRAWISKRFAPGGAGYNAAKTDFYTIAK
jgi:hypothetical protein